MGESHQVPENELWISWKENEESVAYEQLIRKYLPLVDYVAQRVMVALPQQVSKDDLISLGNMGLLDALKKFDYKRGLKFSAFGMWRIRGAMIDGLREDDWAPRSLREKAKKIDEAYLILEQQYIRPPTEQEVSSYLNMTREEFLKVVSDISVASLLSLDEPVKDEEEQNQTRMSHIMDYRADGPDLHIEQVANQELLSQTIEQLPEKEKMVVSLFYYEELTLTEIAHVMDLSPSRISQLHSKAIYRLRGALDSYKKLMIGVGK